MTVSRIREGRGNQLLQHLRIKVKHKVVRTSVGLGKHCADAGFELTRWRIQYFYGFLLVAVPNKGLWLAAIDAVRCEQRIMQSEIETSTKAHLSCQNCSTLCSRAICSALPSLHHRNTFKPSLYWDCISLIGNHNKSSQDQKHSDKIFLEENKWSAKYLDIIY